MLRRNKSPHLDKSRTTALEKVTQIAVQTLSSLGRQQHQGRDVDSPLLPPICATTTTPLAGKLVDALSHVCGRKQAGWASVVATASGLKDGLLFV